MKNDLVIFGASAGGFQALKIVLASLPVDFPAPVLVAQHLKSDSVSNISGLLNEHCQLNIKFAENGDKPRGGNVYIAPPNYHLRLDNTGILMLSNDASINFSRPSIDVLLESASHLSDHKKIVIILTGANNDGTKGAELIKKSGGTVIAQAPGSAEYPTMPQSVIDAIKVDHIIWLDQIGPFIWDLYKT